MCVFNIISFFFSKKKQKLFEMEIPDLEDLATRKLPKPIGKLVDNSWLQEAESKLPPYAQRGKLHRVACSEKLEGYIDPISKEVIPSRLFLEQRPCCGEKCRHCPYNYENVAKISPSTPATPATQFECSSTLLCPGGDPLTVAEAFSETEISMIPKYAIRGKLHRKAIELQRDTYLNPVTSVATYTQSFLEKLPDCCGKKCTHCPFSFRNCPTDDADDSASTDSTFSDP